uniref:LysM domain-containing protein n=1 Tax=Araucaria cunninghamii TaxID=56994 RepID=A0A0D6QR65_ARACU
MERLQSCSLILALVLLSLAGGALCLGFPCKAKGKTCTALVSFKTQTATNLSAITTVFQLKSYRELLGANAWNLSLPVSTTLSKGVTVKVPVTCGCSGGNGTSQGITYTVQPGNTLSIIASTIFGGLINWPDIVEANSNQIQDPNKIFPGQKFGIPLPCRCQSNASSILHYSYVVQAGETLEGIASRMGSSQSELMTLNNISSPKTLAAGQVIGVPLKACSSNISKSSLDAYLLVANGSYAITANNCLQCSCGPSDLDLYCAPATLSGTASCPTMQCKNSDLMVGNITADRTGAGCNVTKCSYSGYDNKTIFTSLKTSLQPQCPAKHVLPTLTTPAATSPSSSPSPSPGVASSPSPGSPGSESAPPSVSLPSSPSPPSTPSNSKASDSLGSLSLGSMLVLGLPLLIHFGEW